MLESCFDMLVISDYHNSPLTLFERAIIIQTLVKEDMDYGLILPEVSLSKLLPRIDKFSLSLILLRDANICWDFN